MASKARESPTARNNVNFEHMNTNNDSRDRTRHEETFHEETLHEETLHEQLLSDEDTDELPIIDPATADRLAPAAPPAPTAGQRAAIWLKRMDAEIEHLQAKWRTIESELTLRDGRIQELQEALQRKDDDRLGLENSYGELQASLAAKVAENERLLGLIEEEKAGVQGLMDRNSELSASNEGLRAQLQDLALYIDGRRSDWAKMNEKLAQYEETLAGMEHVLHGSDEKLGKKEKEKQALSDRILELERKCAELAGRRDEREAACKELQNRLDEQAKANAQIRGELAQQQKEAEKAFDNAISKDKLVASLEVSVARRDETIAELEESLSEQRRSTEQLAAANDKLTARLTQLEDTLGAKVETVQSLRTELKEAKQLAEEREVEAAKVGARNCELEGSWLDHEQSMDELRAQLGAVGEQRRQLADELAASESRAEELQAQLDSAIASAGNLQAEIAAQQELVAQLEADLESKQHMMSALDRSAERLNELSMSLHALNGPVTDGTVETLAIEDENAADYFDIGTPDMLAPEEIGIGEERPRAKRMFIAMDSDDGRHYPVSKADATIGRSRNSDIRIQSVFVSRTHARLHCDDSQTIIEDAGSKNGILVNDEPVGRRVLHDGDIVSLGGKLDLKFVEIH